ncbi:MAG: phosphoribosylformylglycinamidine cyclo-ligase [Oscillospiraceae bacterium]|jgi:phosphoribosylformylglycinamidine cyclo-ligase|nr:phosphoribosylformylglycinamidine cyclo-ligase [Oscillospiraceae bacterium]
MKSESEAYRAAGVDITAGYEAVRRMRAHVARTTTPGVLAGLGGFGGLFNPDFSGMADPELVSGTDGVGTKLKIAFAMDKHDSVGIDCVAMSVNDVICCGAKPLFFLDYIACGKNHPARIEAIVKGVADGCVQSGCALIGGETAELPGFYPEDEYDLAGFAVGIVDREKLLDNSSIRPGDAIIALPSTGVHSNGFSLIRRIFGDTREALSKQYDELGMTLGEALLTPTRIYVRPILALLDAVRVKGISHITGGGFHENIPRSLPEGLMARIDTKSLKTPPIFGLIQAMGQVSTRDMFNTYNMGVGLCAVVDKADADRALTALRGAGIDAYVCGEVAEGAEGVSLC